MPADEVLWRCDQCAHEEWRPPTDEPWLCLVCGYMRWQEITRRHAVAEDDGQSGADAPPSDASRARARGTR